MKRDTRALLVIACAFPVLAAIAEAEGGQWLAALGLLMGVVYGAGCGLLLRTVITQERQQARGISLALEAVAGLAHDLKAVAGWREVTDALYRTAEHLRLVRAAVSAGDTSEAQRQVQLALASHAEVKRLAAGLGVSIT